MNKKLFLTEIVGFIFVGILGTLSIYFFEWSGYSEAIGMVAPVNESCWEHLKLLFFPYLIWSAAEYFILSRADGVLFSKSVASLIGMIMILAFFYTYTGISGESIEWLNILSFFVGAGSAFAFDYVFIKSKKFAFRRYDTAGVILFTGVGILFFLFTVAPPFLPLFKDPISSAYGM